MSGTGTFPPSSAERWLYVMRPRIIIWSSKAQAVPRYSPVGSNPSVHPKDCSSSRNVPPLVALPSLLLEAPVELPPQATATSVSTRMLDSAVNVRRFTDPTPF